MKYFKCCCVFLIISCLFFSIYGEIRLYSDGECSHVLINEFSKDTGNFYVKNVFGLNIKEDYDCWKRSDVRLRTIGKRVDEKNVMDLLNWVLCGDIDKDFYNQRRRVGVHIRPSEYYPCQLIPIYEQHMGLPLLSVGTERGFIGAALAKANELYLVDNTPDVPVYNYIVCLLIRASDNLLNYLYLRMEASFEEWLDAFTKKGIKIRGNLRRDVPYLWEFWDKNVRVRREFLKPMERQVSAIEMNNSEKIPFAYPDNTEFMVNLQRFANANYLYDENLFKHVKLLVDSDKIFIYLADVSDRAQLRTVMDNIYPRKFGIIDLSNAVGIDEKALIFRSPYLDEEAHQSCFSAFHEAADEKTSLVWTSWDSTVTNVCLKRLRELEANRGGWVYRAVPLQQALLLSLGESFSLDIWRSELSSFEGCRTDFKQSTLMDWFNNFFISFTRALN